MVTLPGQKKSIAKNASVLTGNDQFALLACAGSITTAITKNAVDVPPTKYDQAGNTDWGSAQYNYSELLQADQGWLGPDTTLVTITIGGNDARFSDVLTGCILPGLGQDCINSGYYLTRHSNGVVDPKPLIVFEPIVIGLLKQHLEKAYTAIHSAAPNAKIITVGYPLLFPATLPHGECSIGLDESLSPGDTQWLNKMGTLLDNTIGSAVADVAAKGVDIHFVNPTLAFTGHDIRNPDTAWINGLISWSKSPSSGLQIPGAGSFHPKLIGQQELAKLVNKCLAGKLPKSQGTC